MSYFVDKLRLKEAAEEDIYFARRDLELIQRLRNRGRAKSGGETGPAEDPDERSKQFAAENENRARGKLRALRTLLAEIRAACSNRR